MIIVYECWLGRGDGVVFWMASFWALSALAGYRLLCMIYKLCARQKPHDIITEHSDCLVEYFM